MFKRIAVATFAAALVAVIYLLTHSPQPRLKWHEAEGYRWAPLSPTGRKGPGFESVTPRKSGITFTNTLTEEQIVENRHLLNGSGVAIGDVDGDGLADVYFCRLDGGNVLYRNLGGWRFEDITEEAGVACERQFSTGAAFADIDGDGDLDLLVTALGGPNACFLNDGTGRFADFTAEAGIASESGATSLALADVDGDGDLDLYIANYKKRTVRDLYPVQERSFDKTVEKVGDRYVVRPEFQKHYTVRLNGNVLERFEYAEPDMFFLNDGTGRFTRVDWAEHFTDEEGQPSRPDTDWGLSVEFHDFDDDGDPDLYVCNDFESPDRIWLNDGTGHFRALPKLAIRSISASSMGVAFSDIDRDGHTDFFLTEMLSRDYRRRMTQKGPTMAVPPVIGRIDDRPQYMRNTLFLNRGDNTFAEIGRYARLEASEWSWTPRFVDIDLDGYEDLLIVTGHYYDAMDADIRFKLKTMPMSAYKRLKSEVFAYERLELPNFAFRNNGDLTFSEQSAAWGFDDVDIAHGLALGDLDNDGDLDAVVNRLGKPAALYRNEGTAPRLAVRLVGLPPNTYGIGARVKVIGGPVPQLKEVTAGGSYQSHSDYQCVFATGRDDAELTIEVRWPDGKVSRIEEARPNRLYEIHESGALADGTVSIQSDSVQPFFEDVSALLDHQHHETPFDDFRRQPLLPNRLSQLGPGIAWLDYDGDGDDDLFITSGRGGRLGAFANRNATFRPIEIPGLTDPTEFEQSAVVGASLKTGQATLFVGHSNYESPDPLTRSFIEVITFERGRIKQKKRLETGVSSLGTLALADVDGDGDLDLFAGGRTVPGQYPTAPASFLFRNENGTFVPDQENNERVRTLGMVTGATFSDLDGDGDPDLVLALEWGPITVLRNEEGRFRNVTTELGLASRTGWWNGVATGDFNEDGRLDIVATNWGLNSKYRASSLHPVRLYYADFDNNGTLDLVEAHFDSSVQRVVPFRGFSDLAKAMPFIAVRVKNHHDYSQADLKKLFGSRLRQSQQLWATTLAHTLFLNRSDGFEAVPLPDYAQFAPAFHVSVADFDGDGHEDVFISQNFFATQPQTHRNDSGRGLWLRGDGTGNLTPVRGHRSGVTVYGEQRGAGVADFDRDGRVDLVVSQNGAATKLYRNQSGKPGIRVRLVGTPLNPDGIGAQVRLKYANGYGPVREIRAGSGYWSQDSAALVLGWTHPPQAVWVRWPDGRVSETPLEPNQREITIRQ